MSNIVAFPTPPTLLVPEGEYQIAFVRHSLSTQFGRGSLELQFKVVDFGRFFEQPLARFYKVGRDGKRSFRASPHSAFAREFAAVFGRVPPAGVAAVSWYREVVVVANVRTVVVDHRQKPLPEAARYSVISELLRRAE